MQLKVDYITNSDAWYNGAFTPKGIMVHSTATTGVMAQAFRDLWDRPDVGASVHAFVDDSVVVQCLPWNKKAGHAGSGARGSANSTHLSFEVCEPSGIEYNASYSTILSYDPPEGYFEAVWQNAVELCVMLCREFDIDPLEKTTSGGIICHAEGAALGIATDHPNVNHWWPAHEGRTMDDFRKAVKNQMDSTPATEPAGGSETENGKLTQKQFETMHAAMIAKDKGDNPSPWAKEAAEEAKKAGAFADGGSGNYNWQDPVTREVLALIMARAGLLGE